MRVRRKQIEKGNESQWEQTTHGKENCRTVKAKMDEPQHLGSAVQSDRECGGKVKKRGRQG